MVAFVKYQCAAKDIAEGQHPPNSLFAVALTNRAPVVATDQFLSDITEIAPGNGYLAGGKLALMQSSSQAAGVYKLVLADPGAWQAAGGNVGPFRYAVLYNQSTGGSPLTSSAARLIGYWDYGAGGVTLQPGETFTPDLSQANGVYTVT